MRHFIFKFLHCAWIAFFFPVFFLFALWCLGALYYTPMESGFVRVAAIILFLIIITAALCFKPRQYFMGGALILMLAFLSLWDMIQPTNAMPWAPEYERLPRILWHADNNTFEIRDIRDFRYRTTTDFDPVYRNETFQLDQLRALDFLTIYWPQPGEEEIAHVMLRFRFNDGKVFLISSETRRTSSGDFGGINNLYKQSNTIYVIATELDVLSLRTNFRVPRERVYIYEMDLTRGQQEKIFRDLAGRINDLHENPKFYNTLHRNCYTSLIPSLQAGMDLPAFHVSYLVSGWAPEMFFRSGFLKKEHGETFDKLKQRSFLNPALEQWDHQPETYEKQIRQWEKENKK